MKSTSHFRGYLLEMSKNQRGFIIFIGKRVVQESVEEFEILIFGVLFVSIRISFVTLRIFTRSFNGI